MKGGTEKQAIPIQKDANLLPKMSLRSRFECLPYIPSPGGTSMVGWGIHPLPMAGGARAKGSPPRGLPATSQEGGAATPSGSLTGKRQESRTSRLPWSLS